MSGNTNLADQGLLALVMLLRLHGLGADPQQIRHRFGASAIGIPEMLRCARELGLKAKSHATTWNRLRERFGCATAKPAGMWEVSSWASTGAPQGMKIPSRAICSEQPPGFERASS